jgi:hypothetical protein
MTSRTTPAALVLAAVLSACRTAAPARPATQDAARHAPPADVVYVPYSPTILVARRDEAFLLLHAIVVRTSDGPPSLDVAYVASPDVASASAADEPRRAAAAAALLLEALGPMLPPEVRGADVTAVFGAPGTWGLGVPAHAVREVAGWGAWDTGALHRVLVPPLPLPLPRSAEGEREAVEAAHTFLTLADEGDGDGAWALASATIKATTSRRSFEEALWPGGWNGSRGARRERFRQYEVHNGAFRTGDVLLVCFASDRAIESLQMRLDDDQEWRVAEFVRRVTGVERHAPSTPSTPSQSAAAPR